MAKLMLIRVDGALADNTARLAAIKARRNAEPEGTTMSEDMHVYRQALYDPELLEGDTLVPDANQHLTLLLLWGYEKLIFLTERPIDTWETTYTWLDSHLDLSPDDDLIHKAPHFIGIHDPIWFAGMVTTLSQLYGGGELLVINSKKQELEQLLRYGFPESLKLQLALSLKQAVDGEFLYG